MKHIRKNADIFERHQNAFTHENNDNSSFGILRTTVGQIGGVNMKNFILLLFSITLTVPAIGQDFYYGNNRKIFLEKAENWLIVQVREDRIVQFRNETLNKFELKEKDLLQNGKFFWVEKRNDTKIDLPKLKGETNIVRGFPCYYAINATDDTTAILMTDRFRVQFNSHVSLEDVKKINRQYFVEIVNKGFDNEYSLRLTEDSPLNTLEVANAYYENGLTKWAHPIFYMPIVPFSIDDPYFSDQWHLYNTGQDGGQPGIDINVIPAWNITTGSPNITVAVLDYGVEPHEDLGVLLPGYNSYFRTDNGEPPRPGNEDIHGQHVAGIIAAQHNSKGVRGVAPGIKLMSVYLEMDQHLTCTEAIADAVDTAWVRGADIINNSWGYPVEGIWHDHIAAALERAMTNGRNGKGTVVVGAPGNNSNYVAFPANVPGVLKVGAVTNLNERAPYSPVSDLIDIVAPSSGGTKSIATLDRNPPNGYDKNSKYRFNFGGTSAAAPQASGVAALILSENPQLPKFMVLNAIKSTATSYGQTNWAGAGRLNAYQALECGINSHYYENQVVNTSTTIFTGCYVYMKNVSIQNGAIFNIYADEVLIESDFVVEPGSQLEILYPISISK